MVWVWIISLGSNAQIGPKESPLDAAICTAGSGNLITLDETRLHAEVIFLQAIGDAPALCPEDGQHGSYPVVPVKSPFE
jgi:hypothetical protein